MVQPRTLVVVLAGGAGSRLESLTTTRAKPAVPYAGHYRLVDVVLTNCLHSGLPDVWITQQTNPVSLSDHLNGGRPWDLDRTRGGFLALAPRQDKDTGKGGFSSGTADVLWRHTELIRDFGPDALVVVSADAVYALDYEEVVRDHLASDADVTMVTTKVEPDDASRYGVVLVEGGTVTDYEYKPDEPKSDLVTNEVFVFTPGPVLDLLEELGAASGEDGPGDLGDALLPRLVESGRAREHRFERYWRDLGTIPAYWEAHMDLLQDDPPFDPGDDRLAPHHARWQPSPRPHPRRGDRRGLAALAQRHRRRQGLPQRAVAARHRRGGRRGVRERAAARGGRPQRGDRAAGGPRPGRGGLRRRHGRGGDGDIALVGRDERVEADLPAGGRQPQPED